MTPAERPTLDQLNIQKEIFEFILTHIPKGWIVGVAIITPHEIKTFFDNLAHAHPDQLNLLQAQKEEFFPETPAPKKVD